MTKSIYLVAASAVVFSAFGMGRYAASSAERPAKETSQVRVTAGIVALYDFRSADGPVVKDRSGVGEPLDLRIVDPKAVHRSPGSLEVRGKTVIRSDKPAAKIVDAVRRSGEITIEAWIRPANMKQNGPARIVSLSKNTTERNFTLGQERDRFDARLRTTKTDANGMPSLAARSKSAKTELSHVVFARDQAGRARIYIDGREDVKRTATGATSNWDRSFRLALANELTGDRPWLGTYRLVAIYGRILSPAEVVQNYQAGPNAASPQQEPPTLVENRFESHIAPLLARHCLECHDSATKKGGLDLSKKSAAFAGGESGVAIVAGKVAESLLWEYVESDEMPADRPALSADEKNALRQWIDKGADWSLAVIDPTIYELDSRAQVNWVRRLTVPEYIATVQTSVGVDIAEDARRILPPDLRADGFSNTAYNLNVDLGHVEAYSKLAELVVGRMDVTAFAARFSKSRKLTDDDMRNLIAKMGKWVLRGPLDEREIVIYRGISTTVASAGGEFEQAVGYILEAMLQSPRFIYRVEYQQTDGVPRPIDDYELASRLSYMIWGAPPDAELMRAADAGELADRSRVELQVRRMLADPKAVEQATRFAYEWLDLDRLDNLQPSREKFPNWDPALAVDMRDETLAFFREIAWKQNRPLSDLLNAQFTFATPRLARHYGLAPQGDGLSRYDLTGVLGRGGLLTHGSVLTVGGDEASMVARGLFVLQGLLRGSVKDPPPCVDTSPVSTKAGLTQHGIAEVRIKNANCGGCHVKFEPLAYGLEKFDGLGGYHDRDEHGNRLRDDGNVLFPGTEKPVSYKTSADLMNLLAGSDRVAETITWKLTQFCLGRPLTAGDVAILDRIHVSAEKDGGTYASVIIAIATSDLVRMTPKETSR